MCADLFVYREGKENEYSKNSERGGGAAATLPELLYGDCLEIIKSLPDKSANNKDIVPLLHGSYQCLCCGFYILHCRP